jgi:hypothetical protein
MSRHMRTTVRLDDELLSRAKRECARQGRTLTSLIEEGVILALERPRPAQKERVVLPIPESRGGVQPGVDLNNNASLLDIMEDRWF